MTTYPSFSLAVSALAMASGRYKRDCRAKNPLKSSAQFKATRNNINPQEPS